MARGKVKKKDVLSKVTAAKAVPKGWVRSFHKGLLTIYNPDLVESVDVVGVLTDTEIRDLLL